MMLHEIALIHEQFLEAVENGEIPEDAINDTLDSIELEFDAKVDLYASRIKALKAEEAAIKAEASALEARAAAKKKAAERYSEYVLSAMNNLGKDKVETARNLVKVVKKRPSIEVKNSDELYKLRPDLFTVPAPTVSKTAIAEAIKAGEEIPYIEYGRAYRLAVK